MADEREFDVILWGATGFTGQRVATKLAARSGDARWAIAGRNERKLREIAASFEPRPQIVVADSFDRASLEAMARRTRAIATTVGPYAQYGTPLVEACIANGTHCCDLTGEPHWIRTLVDEHHDAARQAGVRIVNCCGFDSIPSDLGAFLVQEHALEGYGEPCDEVRAVVWKMVGGMSGGTVASATGIAQAARDPQVREILGAPYSLNPPGQRRGADDGRRVSRAIYYDDLETWTAPFFMATVNAKIVRRSNALLGMRFGDYRYDERIRAGSGITGRLKAEAITAAVGTAPAALGIDPLRRLLEKTVLPSPGEGPSEEQLARGMFEFRIVGAWDGRSERITARVAANSDPGYGATATMLAESALCLALDDLPDNAGIMTPASAMGDALLARLRAAQMQFEVLQH